MIWPHTINKYDIIPIAWCGTLYVIESDDIELMDAQDLVARPKKIIIVANEYNPLDWHGWLEIGSSDSNIEALSSKLYYVLTVSFRRNESHYTGLAKMVGDPVTMGETIKINLRGIDVLNIK